MNYHWAKRTFTHFKRINSRYVRYKNILEPSRITNLSMPPAATDVKASSRPVQPLSKHFNTQRHIAWIKYETGGKIKKIFQKLLQFKISMTPLASTHFLKQLVMDFHSIPTIEQKYLQFERISYRYRKRKIISRKFQNSNFHYAISCNTCKSTFTSSSFPKMQ